MRDRWTPFISLGVAIVLHLGIVALAVFGYAASAEHPSSRNQAARRLKTLNGQPVRFVYVKDMVPSKGRPMDPSRFSDMNRMGASPNLKKGTSPDPTSFGKSSIRQTGGPGSAPFSRPTVMPSKPSPRPSKAIRPSTGRQGSRQASKKGDKNSNRGTKSSAKQKGSKLKANDNTSMAKLALPGAGSTKGNSADSGESANESEVSSSSPSRRGEPGREGLKTPLLKMAMGSMQGGFDNPIASRLNTGKVSFDTAAWDLGPYARKVQELVQSNWHIPAVQQDLGQKGWVAVRFVVHRDGSLSDIQVVRRCAIPSYNQSALDALRSSNPLPPLPEQVTLSEVRGLFRFFYNMDGDY